MIAVTALPRPFMTQNNRVVIAIVVEDKWEQTGEAMHWWLATDGEWIPGDEQIWSASWNEAS